jgi:hypothetical protein
MEALMATGFVALSAANYICAQESGKLESKSGQLRSAEHQC